MSYKRSSLMQERMEQNRLSILQSARELITQGALKRRRFRRLQNAQAFLQGWYIDILKQKPDFD